MTQSIRNKLLSASHDWNADILTSSPLFHSLSPMKPFMRQHPVQWPTLPDYQKLLTCQVGNLYSASGSPIKFVNQADNSTHFEQQYEPRIYLKGEIQTRLAHWHDFFQVLIWSTFPKLKIIMNKLHYFKAKMRIQQSPPVVNRSELENAITLFDECGAIIVTSDKHFISDIKNFRWKNLFWDNREQINCKLRCYIIGHAMYEKALNPYIGMTSPSVILYQPNTFFKQPLAVQLKLVDDKITHLFENSSFTIKPSDLNPFPILGMPNWSPDNCNESYYDNTNYFRPGRRSQGN